MKYEELKQLLIEHMNNGSTINLKSLLNTLIQCDDVHDIRFCYRDYMWWILREEVMRW